MQNLKAQSIRHKSGVRDLWAKVVAHCYPLFSFSSL